MKGGPFGRESQIELAQFAREPGPQLADRFTERRCAFAPIRTGHCRFAAISENNVAQPGLIRRQQQLSGGAFHPCVVNTVCSKPIVPSFTPCHRCMAAYARQGRQRSACRSISAVVFMPAARSRTRSPPGNASGSDSARIAMYCAVQGPRPRIAHNRPANVAESRLPSNTRAPEATARANSRIASARAAGMPMARFAPASSCAVGKGAGQTFDLERQLDARTSRPAAR